ncbi:V-type ATP synthase subunit K [archaeon]|nr:V-type ATP synthase subunit K [archaeon]
MVALTGTILALFGAGIALGIAGICTALGLMAAGISGAGAVAESKENFKNAMILQAMPQTQTIYAFITALFIVMGTGLLSGAGKEVTMETGFIMLAAGVIVALTAVSAVFQGRISAAGIASCAKNPDAFAPSIVFSGQAETPAIFGFVVALIILVVGVGVLA